MFNGDVGGWNVSSVIDMAGMVCLKIRIYLSYPIYYGTQFAEALMFNQSLCHWGEVLAAVRQPIATVDIFFAPDCKEIAGASEFHGDVGGMNRLSGSLYRMVRSIVV